MQKIQILLIPLFLSTFYPSYSQDSTVGWIRINSLSFNDGSIQNGRSVVNAAEFRHMAPSSFLLNSNLVNYVYNNTDAPVNGSAFSLLLGLQFRDRTRYCYNERLKLRIGLNYFSGTFMWATAFRPERVFKDTLTSDRSSHQVFLDSVTERNYFMNYLLDELELDLSVVMYTPPLVGLSLYAGFGCSGGITYNTQTMINYISNVYFEYRFASSDVSYVEIHPEFNEKGTERFENRPGFGGMLYIPMGVDWVPFKDTPFFNYFSVFYEMRPCLKFTHIPELRTIASTGMQYGFGIKVQW